MAQQAKFEESNIAMLGSDLEKDVRKAAAETEKAYSGAGQKPGIEVWRIENFKVVPWPQDQYGTFYRGDSFIVLYTYTEGSSEKLLYDIHFWLGQKTSQDEAGVAAYMTVVLDDLLGTLPVQYREVDGHETDRFMALWKNKMRVLEGGVDSGFNSVKPEEYTARLLHIKGKSKRLCVREVPLAASSMNVGDVFILDNGLQLFQWNGPESGPFEKHKAGDIMDAIESERQGRTTNLVLDGMEENADFWGELGEMKEVKTAAEGGNDEDVKTDKKHVDKLFRVKEDNDELTVSEVASGTMAMSSLDTDDVFVVDKRDLLYVWVGKDATFSEKRMGMKYATDFLAKNARPMHTPIIRVMESAEPTSFKKAMNAA
eukprot:206899_1